MSFPVPGTPEWGRMNVRRAELIARDIGCQLTAPEAAELEYLQSESLRAIEAAFPPDSRVEQLEAQWEASREAHDR